MATNSTTESTLPQPPPQARTSSSSSADPKIAPQSNLQQNAQKTPPPFNPHTQFCNLVGIVDPISKSSTDYKPWTKTLYARVNKHRRRQKWEYRFTAGISNTLLLTQILIGAILTALGASRSPHDIITVFGALNTVIAGVITYLKGRGQPMRARAFRDELDRCVDSIEDAEAAFLGVSKGVDGYDGYGRPLKLGQEAALANVRMEIEKLTRQYEAAVENSRRNYPDLWVRANEGGSQNVKSTPTRDGNAGGGKIVSTTTSGSGAVEEAESKVEGGHS